MTGYATQHSGALRSIQAKGASVTFSKVVPGTYDAATGLESDATVSTTTGVALRVKGKPETYAQLGLVESEAPTLLFAGDTYGALPPLGARVLFGGETFTVVSVDPLAPDGTAILARVVVHR